MYPIVNTFHYLTLSSATSSPPALSALSAPSPLFARLLPDALQLLHADRAFTASPAICTIRGSRHPATTALLSLVLSSPSTVAQLDLDLEPPVSPTLPSATAPTTLRLTLTDISSIALHLALPLTATPPAPILADLHTALLTATAGLESLLLSSLSDADGAGAGTGANPSTFGIPSTLAHAGPTAATAAATASLSALTELHAAPQPDGNPLSASAAFRRAVAAPLPLAAARACAVAAQAVTIRRDVFKLRGQRTLLENDRRRRQRQAVRDARRAGKNASTVSHGAASLFYDDVDDDDGSGSKEGNNVADKGVVAPPPDRNERPTQAQGQQQLDTGRDYRTATNEVLSGARRTQPESNSAPCEQATKAADGTGQVPAPSASVGEKRSHSTATYGKAATPAKSTQAKKKKRRLPRLV